MADRVERVQGPGRSDSPTSQAPVLPRPSGGRTMQRALEGAPSGSPPEARPEPAGPVSRAPEDRREAEVGPLLQALQGPPSGAAEAAPGAPGSLPPDRQQALQARLDTVESVVKALEANKGAMSTARYQDLAGSARRLLQEVEAELKAGSKPPAPTPPSPTTDPSGTRPPSPTTGPSGTTPPGRLPEMADYEAGVPFQRYGDQKNFPGGGVLGDLERHLPGSYGTQYRDSDPVTWGHETTHGINSHLRNSPQYRPPGGKVNGFYVGGDRAVVLPEPPMRKSEVAPYVPESMRGSRFGQYVTGQRAFENEPLYLMDEWTSYTNGGSVGVELARQGQWRQGGRDAVAGVVEFTGYGFGVARALEAKHPGYLDRNPDLKNFVAWQGLRAMDTFREGLKVPEFSRFPQQHQLLRNFQSSPDAEPMRDFIRQQYGEAYLQRLLYGS